MTLEHISSYIRIIRVMGEEQVGRAEATISLEHVSDRPTTQPPGCQRLVHCDK